MPKNAYAVFQWEYMMQWDNESVRIFKGVVFAINELQAVKLAKEYNLIDGNLTYYLDALTELHHNVLKG